MRAFSDGGSTPPASTNYLDTVLSYVTTSQFESERTLRQKTRPISWIKAARRNLEKFPEGARAVCLTALTIAAEGGKADVAKPLKGLGSGVLEIALPFRGNAFRVVYAVRIAEEIWVLHAFQKKSVRGIKTPQLEIDLVKERLKRVKEVCEEERRTRSESR